jgi:hypothetical protein
LVIKFLEKRVRVGQSLSLSVVPVEVLE